ncbi:helix-turn-helix domain-containing protein [Rhizobium halophilum]|uniref:helix-turn-helix domain-containing protein n=1 Tax=Rhizobium halophilum TaxID=2846852 RepID=UPI001EFD7C7F|nr:helix-turn-helix transcriptional regulator [Rhizobium halophilum]MCF6369597.1 helix-turn-helix transcriptional regulator [Rhizobium halophilum]
MSICISSFEADADKQVIGRQLANAVSEAREAVGYSLEQLAVTTGLTVDELVAVEGGEGADPALLQRIASGLGLPAAAFIAA